jgi:hypothetical protein
MRGVLYIVFNMFLYSRHNSGLTKFKTEKFSAANRFFARQKLIYWTTFDVGVERQRRKLLPPVKIRRERA